MLTLRLLVLLSFLDACFTDIGLRLQAVEEGNPIAKLLYETDVALFYGWKIALPLLLLFLYPKVKANAFVSRMAYSVCAVYAVLFLYHMYWFTHAFA